MRRLRRGIVWAAAEGFDLVAERLLKQTRHLPIEAMTREIFDAPGLNRLLAEVADELGHGRGAVILRGLSREKYNDDELTRLP